MIRQREREREREREGGGGDGAIYTILKVRQKYPFVR